MDCGWIFGENTGSYIPLVLSCLPYPWPWHWPLTMTWPIVLTLKRNKSDVKTRFSAFDLDLWPATLTYNPNLAKLKVKLHTKYQGPRSIGSAVRVVIDWRMDQVHYLPAALNYTVNNDNFFMSKEAPIYFSNIFISLLGLAYFTPSGCPLKFKIFLTV